MTHPLALVCYNRPNHLVQVLRALAEIKPEPLYIFSDGPKDDQEDIQRVKQVRMILLGGIKWTTPVIVTKLMNHGLAKSVVGAVDYILKDHETVIVLEDDCVPGPHFYQFMSDCLDRYEGHNRIMSVSGYAYRLPPDTFEGYPHDVFCFPRPETWGWATWRGAWQHYIRDGKLVANFEEAQRLGVDLEVGGKDVPAIVRNKIRGTDSWSAGWLLGTALAGGLTVYPVKSHVQYIGDDGSGTNMPDSGRWGTDMASERMTRLPDDPSVYKPAYGAMKWIFDSL